MQSLDLFFQLFLLAFTSADIIFYKFSEHYSTLSQKISDFRHKFSFFNSQGRCLFISPWIEVHQKRLFMVGKLLQEPLGAVSTLVNSQNIFCSCWENALSYFVKHIKFLRWSKNQTKLSQKKLRNMTINLPSYISSMLTLILLGSFFINFVVVAKAQTFANCMNRENLTLFLCSISQRLI